MTTVLQPRASAACAACRNRRTKCTTDTGQESCQYCQFKGQQCSFQALKERKRRPTSKLYLNSLLDNVRSLEQRLRQSGHEPPEFQPLASRAQSLLQSEQPRGDCDRLEISALKRSDPDALSVEIGEKDRPPSAKSNQLDAFQATNVAVTQPSTHTTHSPDQAVCDMQRNRFSHLSASTYYGKFATIHSDVSVQYIGRAWAVLEEIPTDLKDYLMNLFWDRYNSTLGIVNKDGFNQERPSRSSLNYSPFLHLLCLAMGSRYADKAYPGMDRVMLNDTRTNLYQEVKGLLDHEIADSRGLTTIQAVLILSDLESTGGRDELAAMYVSVACRLALDLGLHLNHCLQSRLSEREMKARQSLLRVCIIYDQAWALFLGRPQNIRMSDISSIRSINRVSSTLDRLLRANQECVTVKEIRSDTKAYAQIMESFLEFSELVAKVQEIAQLRANLGFIIDENYLTDVATLDNTLHAWYSMLPPHLMWTEENIGVAPRLFFILHQQFYASQLILHSPSGHHLEEIDLEAKKPEFHVPAVNRNADSQLVRWQHLARTVISRAAVKISQSLAKSHQRFGASQTSIFGLQQAVTAALALLCNIQTSKNVAERAGDLQRLSALLEQLQGMSSIHVWAKAVYNTVKAGMERARMEMHNLQTPPFTPRDFIFCSSMTSPHCPNIELSDSASATKMRRLSGPEAHSRSSSELTLVPVPSSSATRSVSPSTGNFSESYATTSAPQNLDIPAFHNSVKFSSASFDHMDSHSQPVRDLSMSSASWQINLSQPSSIFDFGEQSHLDDGFLHPFLPDIDIFRLATAVS